MVVEEHWSSGEAGAGRDAESTVAGCFSPNLPQAEKLSSCGIIDNNV